MPLPLEGVTVLDFTSFVAGPYCSMILGDMGADVIKVEAFPGGDTSRAFDPKINGESYCFAVINRNKRSLAIDLKSAEGKKIVMALAKRADIVTENFRPGVAKRLGIDYESLKELNPGLVYCSLSGFGQTGPYSSKGGYDIIAQGMSGIMAMTGEPDGRPTKVGISMNDIASGVTGLYAILGAYISRLRTGKGQYVETSLLEAGLAWSFWEIAAFFGSGELPLPMGTRHRRTAPYQAYRTADGYITIGANTEKAWQAFCDSVVAQPTWAADPRFVNNSERVKNADLLETLIEGVFQTQPTAHWVSKLDAAGIPAGPVYTFDQALSDPHILARNMIVEIDHPIMGKTKAFGSPVKSSGEFTKIRLPAPWLGQHTADVLNSVGLSEAEISALFDQNVVYDQYRDRSQVPYPNT
ncbi:CaiB Predicted acyl-CoA transferases/carnitine dehydratase [Burkholderiaceae bacterium]